MKEREGVKIEDLVLPAQLPVDNFGERNTTTQKKSNVAKSLDEYDPNGDIPVVGIAHPTNQNLIEIGGWGYFDKESLKFVNEPRTLDKSLLKDVLRLVGLLTADELVIQEDEPLKIKLNSSTINITGTGYSLRDISTSVADTMGSSIPGRVTGGQSVPFATSVTWKDEQAKTSQLRFRGNGTRTMGKLGGEGVTYNFRRLGDYVPTMDDLKVSEELRKILFPKTGLVIVAGETGSGKSTLLAAICKRWLTQEQGIIFTAYEQPCEFNHRTYALPQHAVGQTDLTESLEGSFALAAKDAMRRNSDVILLGEVRDEDSARGLINLGLSGHIAYATFHAGSPMQLISRIISYFRPEEADSIRKILISTIETIICVKLVPTVDGKRVQIRGYIGLDNATKSYLNGLPAVSFFSEFEKIYVEKWHTMKMDLERYKDLIKPDLYQGYHDDFI